MNWKFWLLAGIGFLAAGFCAAKEDAPNGYEPISKLEKARAEAVAKNKLIVLMVKGLNDDCPYCAMAMANGEKAAGAGVVKVFARAEALNQTGTNEFPKALQDRVRRKFSTGASIYVLVFNPDMTQLLAESSRSALESDRKKIAAFQKEVSEHKRMLR